MKHSVVIVISTIIIMSKLYKFTQSTIQCQLHKLHTGVRVKCNHCGYKKITEKINLNFEFKHMFKLK